MDRDFSGIPEECSLIFESTQIALRSGVKERGDRMYEKDLIVSGNGPEEAIPQDVLEELNKSLGLTIADLEIPAAKCGDFKIAAEEETRKLWEPEGNNPKAAHDRRPGMKKSAPRDPDEVIVGGPHEGGDQARDVTPERPEAPKRKWGLTTGLITILAFLALVIGFGLGWLTWGRMARTAVSELADAQKEISQLKKGGADQTTQLNSLQSQLRAAHSVGDAAKKALADRDQQLADVKAAAEKLRGQLKARDDLIANLRGQLAQRDREIARLKSTPAPPVSLVPSVRPALVAPPSYATAVPPFPPGTASLNFQQVEVEVRKGHEAGSPVAGVEVNYYLDNNAQVSRSVRTGPDGIARFAIPKSTLNIWFNQSVDCLRRCRWNVQARDIDPAKGTLRIPGEGGQPRPVVVR